MITAYVKRLLRDRHRQNSSKVVNTSQVLRPRTVKSLHNENQDRKKQGPIQRLQRSFQNNVTQFLIFSLTIVITSYMFSLIFFQNKRHTNAHLQGVGLGNSFIELFDDYEFNERQKDVRYVTSQTYQAYLNSCIGHDEFNPHTNQCYEWFNVGLTKIDSLDTLVIMKLNEQYNISREWLKNNLDFKRNLKLTSSSFEFSIRVVAGLLSAHELTGDKMWLDKLNDLNDVISPYFNVSKTNCLPREFEAPKPHFSVRRMASRTRDSNDIVSSLTSPAECGSLQLEFRKLSQVLNNTQVNELIDRCMYLMIQELPNINNTVPPVFNINTGKYIGTRETIGGNVDSFYEMMFKTYIGFGKQQEDNYLLEGFEKSVQIIFDRLYQVNKGGYSFIGERFATKLKVQPTMDHLVCFFPGVLSLAALNNYGGGLHGTNEFDYIVIARKLMRSCIKMTNITNYGLVSDVISFKMSEPDYTSVRAPSFLRPEIVESLLYLNLIDPKGGNKYKQWGWDLWKKLRIYAQVPNKTDGVWGSKSNIYGDVKDFVQAGKLHSFVIAETFKYFFLLFDDRDIKHTPISPLHWVFNTEGHPLRIEKSHGDMNS